MRLIGDDVADAALEALIFKYKACESGHPKHLSNSLKSEIQCLKNDPSSVDPRIETFLKDVRTVPSWVDKALLQQGQLVFLKYSTSCAFALLYYSLIGGFSAPKIVAVLDETGYLTKTSKDVTWRRLSETFEMVADCMSSDDSLDIEAMGWHSVVKVRLLHARVRRLIRLRNKNWNTSHYGVPINQEDMCGTLLSFSINVLVSVRHIGAPWLTEYEENAYLHLWRYIGYLIGVKEEFNPLTCISRAHGAIESVVLHLLHPNERSQAVAYHVIQAVASGAHSNWTPAMHSEMARWLLGHPLSDALQIKRSFLCYIYTFKVMVVLQLCACVLPLLINSNTSFGKKLAKAIRSAMMAYAKSRLENAEKTSESPGQTQDKSLSCQS